MCSNWDVPCRGDRPLGLRRPQVPGLGAHDRRLPRPRGGLLPHGHAPGAGDVPWGLRDDGREAHGLAERLRPGAPRPGERAPGAEVIDKGCFDALTGQDSKEMLAEAGAHGLSYLALLCLTDGLSGLVHPNI